MEELRQKTNPWPPFYASRPLLLAFLRLLSLRCLLCAFAFCCLLFGPGCLVPPLPRKFSSYKTILAVRYDFRSNIVERLIKKESEFWWEGGISIAEPNDISHYERYGRCVYVDRTNCPSIRFKSLESIGRDKTFWDWFGCNWHFFPLPGTNLWAGIHGATRFYGPWPPPTNDGERDIKLDVYVATPETLHAKQLTASASARRRWFPDLALDAANRHLVYRTHHGYESYDLLDDMITTSGQPSECRALVPRDFGCSDTSDKQLWWEARGTNYWAAIVTGPRDEYSRYAHQIVIRVFNDLSGKPVYRQEIATRNFADLERLQFDKTNHVIIYNSGDDDFIYSVFDNTLKRTGEPR